MKLNATFTALLIRELVDGPYTYADLGEHTGLHYCTVRDLVKALRERNLVRVAEWHTDARGRHSLAAFVFDASGKPDAVKPKFTQYQRLQRRRDKVKRMKEAAVMAGRGQWVQSANGKLRFEGVLL